MPSSRAQPTLLQSFPHASPRSVQTEFLEKLEAVWDDYDVFVVDAPTATGKSALSVAIANWMESRKIGTRIVVPTNQLVSQLADEFPGIPTLYGAEHTAGNWWQAEQRYQRSRVGVSNYHMYLTATQRNRYKNARPTLVIDEAHNTIPFLQDVHAIRFWKHKEKGYPWGNDSQENIVSWLYRTGRGQIALDIAGDNPRYVIDEDHEEWLAGGTLPDGTRMRRSEPEILPRLVLRPVVLRDYPETLWEKKLIKKLVLMSATLNEVDIRVLGLDRRRVCYLHCASPIPAEQRQIYRVGDIHVTYSDLVPSTLRMIPMIDRIAAAHPGENGVIHATYEQSEILEGVLHGDPRYLFHTQASKLQVYDEFRAQAGTGKILVACGMYEGVSLDHDIARWQCITKIPWQSLAAPAVRHQAEQDPEWYNWQTIRTVIQACGRVTRTPSDHGVTYILDRTVDRLYNDCRASGIIPEWFADAWVEEPIDGDTRHDDESEEEGTESTNSRHRDSSDTGICLAAMGPERST